MVKWKYDDDDEMDAIKKFNTHLRSKDFNELLQHKHLKKYIELTEDIKKMSKVVLDNGIILQKTEKDDLLINYGDQHQLIYKPYGDDLYQWGD